MTADTPQVRLRDLVLSECFPDALDPVEAYVARRAPKARAAAREVVEAVAAVLTAGDGTASTFAWHRLRAAHTAAVRLALEGRYPPPLVARMLAALRGVLQECVRLGLMPAEEFGRLRVLLAPTGGMPSGRTSSRRELRSVLETFTDDPAPGADRNGTLRALLHGRHGGAPGEPPRGDSEGVRGQAARAVSAAQLGLRPATRTEALVHVLHEADRCLRQWALCAFLEMLRRGLDLWSAEYCHRHGIAGPPPGIPDVLGWRLRRIADAAPGIRGLLGTLGAALDVETPGAGERMPCVCRVGSTILPDSLAGARVRSAHRDLYDTVLSLVSATLPDVIV